MTGVRRAVYADLETVARLHADCFPTSFLSRAAPSALAAYYRFFLEHHAGICLVFEQEGRVVGFVFGWEKDTSYQLPLVKASAPQLAMAAARAVVSSPGRAVPALLSRFSLAGRVAARLFFPFCFRRAGAVQWPKAHLLSIAVDPSARGRGVGSALNNEFVAECVRRGAAKAVLSVEEDNASAIALYERGGWKKLRSKSGSLRYYRNLGSRP